MIYSDIIYVHMLVSLVHDQSNPTYWRGIDCQTVSVALFCFGRFWSKQLVMASCFDIQCEQHGPGAQFKKDQTRLGTGQAMSGTAPAKQLTAVGKTKL